MHPLPLLGPTHLADLAEHAMRLARVDLAEELLAAAYGRINGTALGCVHVTVEKLRKQAIGSGEPALVARLSTLLRLRRSAASMLADQRLGEMAARTAILHASARRTRHMDRVTKSLRGDARTPGPCDDSPGQH